MSRTSSELAAEDGGTSVTWSRCGRLSGLEYRSGCLIGRLGRERKSMLRCSGESIQIQVIRSNARSCFVSYSRVG